MYTTNTKIRSTVKLPPAGNFNKYIEKLINIIDKMELFRSVGIQVRDTEAISCPMCIVYPLSRVTTEQLTGGTRDVRYNIGTAIAIQHPDDSIVTQQILDYAEALDKELSTAITGEDGHILIFNDIPGHYNTEIQTSNFGDVKQVSDTVLAYNTGINVVFSAFEIK